MSLFGIVVGLLLVVIVFYHEGYYFSNRKIDDSLNKKKPAFCRQRQKRIRLNPSFEKNIQGPYWNSFYRPTYWTTDDQYLWPYWSWYQRGYVIPGPLYPYYNKIDSLLMNENDNSDQLRQQIKEDILSEFCDEN